jgi:hypothetical protein
MAANSSWRPTQADRLAYAERLKGYATIDAQAHTQDPAAAVADIEWMIENYLRPDPRE